MRGRERSEDRRGERNERAAEVLRWQLACGLRVSEAVGLRLDKLDSEQGMLETKP